MEFFITVIVLSGMFCVYSLLKQLIAKMPDGGPRAAKSKRAATPPPPPPDTNLHDVHHRAEDLMKRINVLEEIIGSEKSAERSSP